jgi:hypothetical protein
LLGDKGEILLADAKPGLHPEALGSGQPGWRTGIGKTATVKVSKVKCRPVYAIAEVE